MNNSQFRRLVFDKPDNQNGESSAKPNGSPANFGGKRSSFMPMTPRTVKGGQNVDFARQVREREAALQPAKKFKTSAPKGAKYGAGYTDRAKARADAADDGDEKGNRIKALEEQMKLGQISQETFEALRDEITGGDVGSTHLIKGLDRRLLERVRKGEDVLGTGKQDGGGDEAPDVDDELDKLGEQEVEAVKRERVEKKGSMAPPPPVAGVKRSRDELMAELKAQRKAAAEAKAAAQLDTRWRKVGEKEKSRIEIDHKGREVLITVDEDGMVKKRVRKAGPSSQTQASASSDAPDASKPILGADAVMPQQVEAPLAQGGEDDVDDDDIFEGVGTEYNPLGDMDDADDSIDESEGEKRNSRPERKTTSPRRPERETTINTAATEEDATKKPAEAPRNYFKDTTTDEKEAERNHLAGVQDLLKKAARMDPQHSADADAEADEADNEANQARLKKRAAMLAQDDRDLQDMDMGFGGSRFEDGEEEGGEKIRLSEWKGSGGGDDELEDDGKETGGKRKRKPKKRKGDVNNAADIMRVLENRKAK